MATAVLDPQVTHPEPTLRERVVDTARRVAHVSHEARMLTCGRRGRGAGLCLGACARPPMKEQDRVRMGRRRRPDGVSAADRDWFRVVE